jgi:hypothetical protein
VLHLQVEFARDNSLEIVDLFLPIDLAIKAFILKLDIQGYFMHIKHEVIYQKVLQILDKNKTLEFTSNKFGCSFNAVQTTFIFSTTIAIINKALFNIAINYPID